jgi:hypothetical protein|tara:strand:- start:1597 stop:1827 length:231 start_codon:yes stop_codon:yes gene_type:complete
MVKMFLMICVVWIEGSRYEGGQTNCMMHISKVEYSSLDECRADLNNSKRLVIDRLRDEFGDGPEDYNVQASCMKAV